MHIGFTRARTDAWVAHQLREATPCDEGPTYLLRDIDGKYRADFDRVATGTGIKVLRSPFKAPRANAICERFLGSLRRECLDHILILSDAHFRRVLNASVTYCKHSRPHQGIDQRVPEPRARFAAPLDEVSNVVAFPVLGGLHHEYRRAA